MKNKMLIVTTLFAIAASGAFAQDLSLADSGYADPAISPEAVDGTREVTAMTSSDPDPNASHGKTRKQVLDELSEYNRQNPRGYLYSYYLGHGIAHH